MIIPEPSPVGMSSCSSDVFSSGVDARADEQELIPTGLSHFSAYIPYPKLGADTTGGDQTSVC